jgi:hypothetical protein
MSAPGLAKEHSATLTEAELRDPLRWDHLPDAMRVCILVSEKVRMQELSEIEKIVEEGSPAILKCMLWRRGTLWDRNVGFSHSDRICYILTALIDVRHHAKAMSQAVKLMMMIRIRA